VGELLGYYCTMALSKALGCKVRLLRAWAEMHNICGFYSRDSIPCRMYASRVHAASEHEAWGRKRLFCWGFECVQGHVEVSKVYVPS
jgi:hypothetical protein